MKKIKKFFLDTLFPVSCISCGKNDVWLCRDCIKTIKLNHKQLCPICEKLQSINGETCHKCQGKNSLDGLLVCTDYRENKILKKAIHLYKYRFVKDIFKPLGKIMHKKLAYSSLPIPDIIIPVPLHSKRLRWRGFNQCELLARYISMHLTPGMEIPLYCDVLLRKKHTNPQMSIKNYQERKANLQNAFEVSKNNQILKGKNILLVDDISTTGSTLFECAKTLKKRNAKKVFAIVLARPKPKKSS
ncbi:MAG: ComF family protein [Candidatus Moranbacteria bacterium]|nr:ComF family protein [Candidatus Moranbacteria bacterium]